MAGGEERSRIVKLYCPSLSKAITLLACDEQRIDLGHIAGALGLDPASLKLNGHFIARGADLLAASVTWRSLLSFFSSRGFPTGGSDSDAIVVKGKLCKAGTKRVRELEGSENEIYHANSSAAGVRQQLADFNLVKTKKLKENNSGCIDQNNNVSICHGYSLKRKHHQEDFIPLKRLVIK